MLRRLISLMLIVLVPCWMQAAMGPAAACPANVAHSQHAMNLATVGQPSEPLPSGHECCPPVPKVEEICGHSRADIPVCNMHSSECCQAKAPDGQVPPAKTTVSGLATQLSVIAEVAAVPRVLHSSATAAKIPPFSDVSSLGMVLRI